jgi:cell division initiation protein
MVKSFHWGHLAPYGDGMGLTPLDIQQQRFRSRFGGGLDKAEVDAFLNLVATEMEKLVRDNNELREDQRATRRLLEDYRSREDTLKETMITAQKVTEEIKRAADKEADIILGRAELDAERIIERAQDRLTELLRDIAELKRQRAQFLSQTKAVVDQHRALLAVADDDEGAHRLEENLAVLRKRVAGGPAPVSQVPHPGKDG